MHLLEAPANHRRVIGLLYECLRFSKLRYLPEIKCLNIIVEQHLPNVEQFLHLPHMLGIMDRSPKNRSVRSKTGHLATVPLSITTVSVAARLEVVC